MKKLILLAICPLFLIACKSNKIFEQYKDIDNNKWSRDNVISFNVNIEDISIPYDVSLAIRHSSYYVWADIMVNMTVIYPSEEERTKDHDLMLRNKDGSFKAEGAGDLWDITFPIFSSFKFTETGKYQFKVQNIMPQPVTEDIMQVGLIVKKSKQ
jgi:gliding motility-associated lipoprotein GldH